MRWMVCLIAFAAPATAAEWERVFDDAGITAALADRTLVYDEFTMQWFGADGGTTFITERASDGRWSVRSGQYCSQWPPSDGWACYDIQVKGNQVKFISSDRSESVGTYRE